MPAGDYIEGFVLFGLMLAACAGGALVVARARFATLEGAGRLLAVALVTTLGVLAVHLLPAMLGLLARGSVIVAALLWLGACLLLSWRRGRTRRCCSGPRAPGDGNNSRHVLAFGSGRAR